MRWEDSQVNLMRVTVASALLGAAMALIGIGQHAGFNVAVALLGVLSALCGYRAWRLSTYRQLESVQRSLLLARLGQLPPLTLHIAAIDDDEAVNFARQLLEVFREAGWPARSIGRTPAQNSGAGVGLFLAVQEDYPADGALVLIVILRECGLPVTKSTKPADPDNASVDLFVGRRETR
jgi:hypothetical protein